MGMFDYFSAIITSIFIKYSPWMMNISANWSQSFLHQDLIRSKSLWFNKLIQVEILCLVLLLVSFNVFVMYFENSKSFVNSRNNDDNGTKDTQLDKKKYGFINAQKLNSDARTDDVNNVHFGISN